MSAPPSTLRVLALGDLVGRPGRRILRECLKQVRTEHRIDFVIVNVENATNGAGVRPKEADEILGYGADSLTSGDHILDHDEILTYLEREPRLIRPCNYSMPGRGYGIYDVGEGGETKIGVINVTGAVFMRERCETRNGFPVVAEIVVKMRKQTPIIFVDVHCEATSEKLAMGWHLDGSVSGVFGTHTHVQTADVQVLPKGTGFITDLGMVGPHLGVIGRDVECVVDRFRTGKKAHLNVASEWIKMNGVIFEVETETGRCTAAELFSHSLEQQTGVDN